MKYKFEQFSARQKGVECSSMTMMLITDRVKKGIVSNQSQFHEFELSFCRIVQQWKKYPSRIFLSICHLETELKLFWSALARSYLPEIPHYSQVFSMCDQQNGVLLSFTIFFPLCAFMQLYIHTWIMCMYSIQVLLELLQKYDHNYL